MGFLSETRFIERLQFFNGQRLFASDLQGVEAFNREMRWLHNQSLHQPGIGSGFQVSGRKGEREITIKPGYAIDALGREIVLTETQIEPVPPVASEDDGRSVFYDVTVSYPDDEYLEEAETREGVCLPRGVVRLREEPVLCWVRLRRDDQDNLHVIDGNLQSDIKEGLKIVLTRVEILNCQLEKDISIAERLSARPAKQPYIASGEVSPASSQWNFIEKPVLGAAFPANVFPIARLSIEIDTKNAGFLTPPFYSAQIVGSRLKSAGVTNFILDGFLNIRETQNRRFTLEVSLIAQLIGTQENINVRQLLNDLGSPSNTEIQTSILRLIEDWKIVWMGTEG